MEEQNNIKEVDLSQDVTREVSQDLSLLIGKVVAKVYCDETGSAPLYIEFTDGLSLYVNADGDDMAYTTYEISKDVDNKESWIPKPGDEIEVSDNDSSGAFSWWYKAEFIGFKNELDKPFVVFMPETKHVATYKYARPLRQARVISKKEIAEILGTHADLLTITS